MQETGYTPDGLRRYGKLIALNELLSDVCRLMQDAQAELGKFAEGSIPRVMVLARLTALMDVKGLIEDEIDQMKERARMKAKNIFGTVVTDHTCCGITYEGPVQIETYKRRDGSVQSFMTVDISAAKKSSENAVRVRSQVSIPIDFCPWCGEKLVRDDD